MAVESTGAQWRLTGSVKLLRRWHPSWFASNYSPNCLRLTRRSSALSLPIQAAASGRQLLSQVEIATLAGKVTLHNAHVVGSVSTHEGLEVTFTFQKIDIESTGGGISTQDDWSSYPP
jgi:hypothetical protein